MSLYSCRLYIEQGNSVIQSLVEIIVLKISGM